MFRSGVCVLLVEIRLKAVFRLTSCSGFGRFKRILWRISAMPFLQVVLKITNRTAASQAPPVSPSPAMLPSRWRGMIVTARIVSAWRCRAALAAKSLRVGLDQDQKCHGVVLSTWPLHKCLSSYNRRSICMFLCKIPYFSSLRASHLRV